MQISYPTILPRPSHWNILLDYQSRYPALCLPATHLVINVIIVTDQILVLSVLYYRDSLALAVFALVLTAALRKMQEMSIEMPYWISTTTSFILSNRAGRFLILTDDDSKLSTTGILGGEGEDNSDLPKSGREPKESSWRHFAAIIEWLSFFVTIFTYIIILITLVPSTWKIVSCSTFHQKSIVDSHCQ